eukprot:TRINITY_DN2778_c0_g2_i1.p1 TRINITY_DN2778_c0_g2~~TRINITY_DN2778_c0_g2_i1.p1  ORF type:complete len:904 (+),score=374.67 TRINITY_DN2778_c0_g2_i1:43-2712(+)
MAPKPAAPPGQQSLMNGAGKRKQDEAGLTSPDAKKRATGSPGKGAKKPSPKAKAKAKAADKPEKTDEEKAKAAAKARYFQMMRGGYDNSALHKDSKPSPNGDDTCLDKMTFVVTGRLESMDRADAETLIKKHGGAMRTGVSKKLSYLVVGDEPGESKIRKAKECNTPHLTEDGLIKLIVSASEKKGVDAWQGQAGIDRNVWGGLSFAAASGSGTTKDDAHCIDDDTSTESTSSESTSSAGEAAAPKPAAVRKETAAPTPPAPTPSPPTALSFLQSVQSQPPASNRPVPFGSAGPRPGGQHAALQPQAFLGNKLPVSAPPLGAPPVKETLWADKYAPTSTSKIVGHGSKVHELRDWLLQWRANAARFRANPKGKMDWKSGVCISGPPGIGKTTTSTLVAKECGYDILELNASDHRSQKSLREKVTCLLGGQSVLSMFSGAKASAAQTAKKDMVIIMDEIGGLDRGGTTEIIAMLKAARTPIICICNDKYAQKLKALLGHCMDMPFQRPAKNTLAHYLKKLLNEREGVELHEQALVEVLEANGNDLRATLNNLQMWCRTSSRMGYDEMRKNQATAMKDADMSPFASAQKLFDNSGNLTFQVAQKLFFDNDLMQLFVQENYIHSGGRLGADRMPDMARASRSIGMADVMDTVIRRSQNWSLGSAVAFAAAYYPVKTLGRHQLTSYLPPMVRQNLPCFPGYLGKLSTMNKNLRMATGITREGTASGKLSCSSRAMTMEFLPALRRRVEAHLKEGDAQAAADLLAEYKICKFDWDFAQEVDTFKKMGKPSKHEAGDTKTKSAMTRALNKLMDTDEVKSRRSHIAAPSAGVATVDDDEGDDDGSDDDLIAPKKAAAKKGAAKPAAKKAPAKRAPAKKRPATEAKEPAKRVRKNTR